MRKGDAFVDDWLEKHFCLFRAKEDFSNGVGQLVRFKEQFRGISGSE